MIDLTSNKITIEVNNLEYDGNMWGYIGIYGNIWEYMGIWGLTITQKKVPRSDIYFMDIMTIKPNRNNIV